ncbi:Immunoglobulin [Trinorchestia longiramus]|nr:Immunoglobulin [Trinorchestia longiramus]
MNLYYNNIFFPAPPPGSLINFHSHKSPLTFQVGWMRADTQTILSLHNVVVTHNTRISVTHDEPHTWNLHIRQVKESDRGCYMCQINTATMKKTLGCIDVHVPPNILDSESSGDVTVVDGGSVTLVCAARGYPAPRITWRREDGDPIVLRRGKKDRVKVPIVEGETLELTRVNRRQMGAYQCIANNDVPPAVVKRIVVNVEFAPSISVLSQLVGSPLGEDLELRCDVEAWPPPIAFWKRTDRDNVILDGYVILDGCLSLRVTSSLTDASSLTGALSLTSMSSLTNTEMETRELGTRAGGNSW